MEIDTVVNTHKTVCEILQYYLNTDIIQIIFDYCNGFVHIGNLITKDILQRNITTSNFSRGKRKPFTNSSTEVSDMVNKYISFQIKYIHNLYFFDFWVVDKFDFGGFGYPSVWNISHYNYIYKNGTVLRDKIKFIIESGMQVTDFNSSYPIYNIEKLKQEYFNNFNCSTKWCLEINTAIEELLKYNKSYVENKYEYNQIFIHKLFKHFYNVTECEHELFYENNTQFNL